MQGHLEFFICNADNDPDGIPTQECFNEYPLTRAEGDDYNSPVDPNFPGRYYCDPTCRGKTGEVDQTKPLHAISGENMIMRYVLPDIECSHCILQMVYREWIVADVVVLVLALASFVVVVVLVGGGGGGVSLVLSVFRRWGVGVSVVCC